MRQLSPGAARYREARLARMHAETRADLARAYGMMPHARRLDDVRHTVASLRLHREIGALKPRKRMPRQAEPTNIQRSYGVALVAIIRRFRALLAPLLEALPSLVKDAAAQESIHRDGARLDADGYGKRVRELMDRARRRLADTVDTSSVETLARTFARQTATYQRIQLAKQLRAALGADPFMADRRLVPLTEAFVDSNVGLIRSLTDRAALQVEDTVMNGLRAGRLHADLAQDIEERLGVAESRARLIARDQVGKFYGQVNAARQRSLGVTRFIWRTVNDERVRDEHDARNGETYEYDDPPDGELPGEPINCRCYAEPVLDDILDAATQDPDEG